MQFAATTERCNATLAFAIDDGDIDGVDVSGRTFVLMVDSPPLMSEGGWNVGVIVDDGASPEQVEAWWTTGGTGATARQLPRH